jgi:hypothetical protein
VTDYSNYPAGDRFYTGVERKKALTVNGRPYFLKFQKKSRDGLCYNHISEYLGSHIFALLGITAQETHLGTYKGEQVVAVLDFLKEGEVFIPFNGVGESSLEQNKEQYQYSYEDIIAMLNDNLKLTDVPETIDRFWDMFIIDAFIANFDRHGSNWGFIKKENKYRIAPVFDNGSCLFPKLNSDEKIDSVLLSEDEINKRIFNFPTSQVKHDGKKSSYYSIISSLAFDECNKALLRITDRIDMSKIERLVEKVDGISAKRKEFYMTILKARFNRILLDSYKALKE